MSRLRITLLALTLVATLTMVLGAAGVARADTLQPGESRLLYTSANRVMQYDAGTEAVTTITYVEGGTPTQPTRALGGTALAWSVRSLSEPLRTYVRETFTHPGQQTTHVLNADLYTFPRLSPDGTKLLYIAEEPDPGGGLTSNLHVWEVADGTDDLLVTDVDGADWSPDGKRIVLASYPRARFDPDLVALYVYDVTSAVMSKVPVARLAHVGEVNTYSPRWSPSGDWIAFQRTDFNAGTASIVLTDPEGSSEKVLMTAPWERLGMGMEWVRTSDGTERLFVDSVEAGGAPYLLVEVPGTHPGPADDRILHAALSGQAQPDFDDVTPDHTFYREIRDLAALRVMTGFDDGSFGASAYVKRAQYAKMISVALGVHDSVWTGWNGPTFPDVPRPSTPDDDFRYPFDYVEEAAVAGLVRGDISGRFKPWAEITRVQLALMIARAGGDQLEPAVQPDYEVFTDLSGLSQEARDAIALVYHNGIINGKTATTFAPQALATRGHAAAMTWRLMEALDMVGS